MRLYILDHGSEILDKSYFIAGANSATRTNVNPTNVWITIPIQTYLIQHEDGYVLFDTGCDCDFKENWPTFIEEQSPYTVTEEQHLLNRLAQLNISPNEIKYVVISHLHVDHAGNLRHFKNAEVYVNDEEFTTTIKEYTVHGELDVHVPSDIRHFLDADLNWRLVSVDEKELELLKGITILNFGSGHSFGMLGLKVDLENTGPLLLVADAIYFEENIKPAIKVPGILYDSIGYKRTAKYIIDYAKKTNSRIIYGHDIQQFNSLKKSTEGYYD